MWKYSDPVECPHEHYKVDAFMRDFGVRRSAPGRHICADCGSPAQETGDGVFTIHLQPEELARAKQKYSEHPEYFA